MTRTVVIGKRKDLVQRILYILTYFIRCSELQENHLVHSRVLKKGEQLVQGSKVTTLLEKGEVEDSEYVVITLNKESALLSPSLPCNLDVQSPQNGIGLEPADISVTTENSDGCFQLAQRTDPSPSNRAMLGNGGSCKETITLVKEAKVETLVSVTRMPAYNIEDVFTSDSLPSHVTSHHSASKPDKKAISPVQLSDWAKEVLRMDPKEDESTPGKVTFRMGCSPSSDSALKSLHCKTEESPAPKNDSLAAQRRRMMHSRIPSCEGGSSLFDEYFVEGNSIETNTVESLPCHSLLSEKCFVSSTVTDNHTDERTCENDLTGAVHTQVYPPPISSQSIPCGDPLRKTRGRLETNIPRNKSYDSALGHSDEELNTGHTPAENWDHNSDHEEVELPLPR